MGWQKNSLGGGQFAPPKTPKRCPCMYILILSQNIVKYLCTVYVYCGNKCFNVYDVENMRYICHYNHDVIFSATKFICMLIQTYNAASRLSNSSNIFLSGNRSDYVYSYCTVMNIREILLWKMLKMTWALTEKSVFKG